MKRTSIFILLLFSLLFAAGTQAQNTIRMNSNQRLDKGQKIEVAGKGNLSMQTDGNLVVYDAANQPRWATGTAGKTVTHVIMQPDGNLVIYNNTTPVWASDTWNAGANGGYFQVDLDVWNGRIYKANGAVAKELFAHNVQVVVLESTTITGTPTNTSSNPTAGGGTALKFPRQQNWEVDMCKALGMTGVAATFSGLTDFQKAIGDMALGAAEAFYPKNNQPNIAPQQVIQNLKAELIQHPLRDALVGLMVTQITKKLALNQNDAQSAALREWAVQVYRKIKADAALGTLKEYLTWKNNPCTYAAPGYEKPQDCYTANNPYNSMWKTSKPPSDLLLKAGMAYACNNKDEIVRGVAGGIAAAGMVGGFYSIGVGGVSLNLAFGGTSAAAAAGVATTSATAWASIASGPVAVITAAVLIGFTQGVAIVEGEQVEWKLRQAVNVAMKENISIANVVAEQTPAALFYVAAVKSAQDGWKAPSLEIEGEVTFFCEAGYVSKFYLTYTLNGQPKSFSTNDMSAGYWQKFTIPAAAKNIVAKGVMISAGEHQVFNQTIERPTYVCYKTYGTIFQQAWNNDWPLSVGGEVSGTAYKVKFFHQAGYVANFLIAYSEPGKTAQTIVNPVGKTAGWTETYTIPANATNVGILIQGGTGLAWEPWRTTYFQVFPTAPNLCIKIYGTSLDQKWNSDCN